MVHQLTEENYLRALAKISVSSGDATVTELAAFLEISKPTVTEMIRKMVSKGFVISKKYGKITLTDEGQHQANLILRRHRLWELFLVNELGFGWEEVHEIADHLEHIPSQKLIDRIDKRLNYPETDPHGNPIPNSSGTFPETKNTISFDQLNTGATYKIVSVYSYSSDLLKFLNSMDIHIGKEITFLGREKIEGSIMIALEGNKYVLTPHIAKSLRFIEV